MALPNVLPSDGSPTVGAGAKDDTRNSHTSGVWEAQYHDTRTLVCTIFTRDRKMHVVVWWQHYGPTSSLSIQQLPMGLSLAVYWQVTT